MKAVLVSVFLALAHLAAAAPSASNGDAQPRPQLDLGIQISLTTGGYKFDFTDEAPTANAMAKRQEAFTRRQSFAATAVLINLSRSDVKLHYPSEAAAANRFTFRVLKADGTVVWESHSAANVVGTPKEVVLGRKGVLRRTMQIPLRAHGGWLPTGRYTLEARAGTDGPSATSIFEVASPEAPPGDTGITGRVYRKDLGGEPVGVLADVSVSQFVLNGPAAPVPFRTTVTTDADGYYRVVTPPGSYFVTVDANVFILTTGLEFNPIASTTKPFRIVNVAAGRFTTYDFPYYTWNAALLPLIPVINTLHVVPNGLTTNSYPGTTYLFLEITATGTVPTGGYRNPRLVKHQPLLPTDVAEPGVLEYDFLIDPPDPNSVVTQAFESHTATISTRDDGYPKVVRVYARGNSQEWRQTSINPPGE